MSQTLGLSGDLPKSLIALAIVLALAGLVLLGVELSRRRGTERPWLVAATGVLASLLCLLAVLRPVVITARGSRVGPKVTVLVDRSRSLLLPGDDGRPRWETADQVVTALKNGRKDVRFGFFAFGEGKPLPLPAGPPRGERSDLGAALRDALAPEGELPRAIVVVSDGAVDLPLTPRDLDGGREGAAAIPIHTVLVARNDLRDASIRAIRSAGAAVAHQPLHVTIEVGCTGGLSCGTLPLSVRELLDGAPPALLASGVANLESGSASVELSITLDRAGPRLVVVELDTPSGDQVPENNRRYLAFDVTRERVRVLHVAGRPTYDVRALRTWLKSNASVDTVAFFILRSNEDDVVASDSELALIKFPVEELFTAHLPSFDAVILQDFNAIPYGLYKYLPNLTKYVETGGGLVMVGGPDAFLGGGYDGTPLERVLPVELGETPGMPAADLTDIVPRATAVGRAAPMLAPLRALFGDELPTMPGSNVVGGAKPGALVLWEHPFRKTKNGRAMPLLTLGDAGDGRAVAIGVDGVHRLGFSELAARVAGRGHGALWDGMLGWLMRDPRFEPAQVSLERACVADEPLTLRVIPLPGMEGPVVVDVSPADARQKPVHVELSLPPGGDGGAALQVPVGALPAGGYIAKVRVGSGTSTRRAFPCEKGGEEWADSRPSEARLVALSKATGGNFVRDLDVSRIAFPEATLVNAEHRVSPIVPPWAWTLSAALALSLHWIARRRGGLALRRGSPRRDGRRRGAPQDKENREMPSVLVADVLSEKGLTLLRGIPGLDVTYEPALTEAGLVQKIKGFHGLVVRSGTHVTADVIAAANTLSVIGRAGVGIQNIDVAAASMRGIVVMNTPTGNAVATAEHTLALLFSLAKRVPEADRSLRSGAWDRERFLGRELTGRTLGVVGLGNVGRIVAERAVALKMRVIAADPLVTAERASSLGVTLVSIEQLLRAADAITVHAPLTAETKGIIDESTLGLLKPGVLLINTAEGGIYDEAALVQGLRDGRIGGVALDVFATEPLAADHPLLTLPNVIVTPHLGASTEEAQERVVSELAEQLVGFFTHGTVTNGVNVPNVPREIMEKIAPFVDLARRLGLFVASVWPHKPKAVEVELVGSLPDGGAKAVIASAVAGVLARFVGAEVNQVAAPFLAQERGIVVRETRHAGPFGRYAVGISVKLIASGGDTAVVRGTVGTDGSARLVGWNGFEVEAPLAGTTVVVTNQDRPGVIGALGTIFGESFINVSRVTLGLRPADRKSVSLWNLDLPVPKHVLAALSSAANVEQVTVVTLPKG